jgi:hypothetical protein
MNRRIPPVIPAGIVLIADFPATQKGCQGRSGNSGFRKRAGCCQTRKAFSYMTAGDSERRNFGMMCSHKKKSSEGIDLLRVAGLINAPLSARRFAEAKENGTGMDTARERVTMAISL